MTQAKSAAPVMALVPKTVYMTHLAGMVDYEDGYPVCIGEALQLGDVPGVGRVAVVTGGGPDHLQRVGDHQREVRKAFVEIGELVQEAAAASSSPPNAAKMPASILTNSDRS